MRNSIYENRGGLFIGFHGCDESVRDSLVMNPNHVKISQETYDWLGHGFYVWENNFERALDWAKDKKKRGTLDKPSVVGVVYQLNLCLDFTDSLYTKVISEFYHLLKVDLSKAGKPLPKNRDIGSKKHSDLIIRELDCAVIEYMHNKIETQIANDLKDKNFSLFKNFDTVRGVFTEGGPAFDGAGIQTKNHIQICIRNLDCIKAFFIPKK
jgi:hypothetical protein